MRALVLAAALLLGTVPPALAASGPAAAATRSAHAVAPVGHPPVRVLLLGDSIALTLGIGLAHDSRSAFGVTVSNHSTLGCDLDPDLEIFTSGKPGPATPGCGQWQGLWPFLTAAVHPQVVALGVGRWEVSNHFYRGHWVHIGQKVWDDHLASDLRKAAAIFRLFGAKVVLFSMPYIDPPDRQPDGQPWIENTPGRARLYNQLIERLSRQHPGEFTVVDLNKMLDPEGVYTPVVNGVTVRWDDGIHVSTQGGEFLQHEILPVIDRLGVQAERVQAQLAKADAKAKAARVTQAKPAKQPHR